MKKMFALAAVLCLALAGCEYDDAEVKDRLDDLEGRVDALEKTVNSLNINVGNLQSLIDGKLFITAVTENPEGGGYTLSLVTSDGEASQIVIKDGEAGAAPAIGVKLDSDGKYYWTLDGESHDGCAFQCFNFNAFDTGYVPLYTQLLELEYGLKKK